MNDKLPVDYRDYPRAYVGQPKRHPSEPYGDLPDPSKSDQQPGLSDSKDKLDADRPAGAASTPVVNKKITIVWKARGH